ncbi:MAG: ORF6N domain-containing protein [Bacteroidota bacterium]
MKKFYITKSDDIITSRIFTIRGMKVMIDRDLAELYGVETKRLKEAVRRNSKRFPYDFMFEMSKEEFDIWRTQFATSNSDLMGLRHKPFCFTEQGVTMLSCILNSEQAIQVNIRIIRVFVKMRELAISHKDILLKLDELESKVSSHDEQILLIFEYLKKLITPETKTRKRVGYRINGIPDELSEPRRGKYKHVKRKR